MVINNKQQKDKFFDCNFFSKNRKAWTSVLEVFVSILLIAVMITLVVNSNVIQKPKLSEQIYKDQALTLKIIQMDDDLRGKVIGGTLTNSDIENMIPDYLDCNLNNIPANLEDKEIYAKSVLITTDMNTYDAKELKLFCWKK